MPEQSISKQLQKSIVIYSALGIFAISLIVALVSIVPLYNRLKQGESRNLLFAAQTRSLTVEEYLSRSKDITLQIASRTKAREQLAAYNQGKVNLTELRNITQGILSDAINQSQEIAGICRLARNGKLVAQVGLPIPEQFWSVPDLPDKQVLVTGPIKLVDQSYLVLGTPIIDKQSTRIGTDVVLFNVSTLQRIVEDYTGLGKTGETVLGAIQDNRVQMFSPLRQNKNRSQTSIDKNSPLGLALEKAARQATGILPDDQSSDTAAIIAYSPIKGSQWGLVVKMNKEELYASVNNQILTTGIAIAVLILLGTFGLVLLLRPLTEKIIILTDELKQQIQEKTATLERERYQHQRIEEALQQMDELRASSRNTAQQAAAAAAEARQALMLATGGTQAVGLTLEGMAMLKENVGAIAEEILELRTQTYQVGSISALVSELANQTNMLALNAAVEAVRAGEKGKGFGVVAAEIRKLADQSKNSAHKIHALVSDIQTAINSTVKVTDRGTMTVEAGVKISQETADAFRGVADAVNKVVENNQQILLTAQQQAIAIQQVVDAINAINHKGIAPTINNEPAL